MEVIKANDQSLSFSSKNAVLRRRSISLSPYQVNPTGVVILLRIADEFATHCP
ncbi:MAG: hypothetical protein ABI443_04005 [Chthoniobacterales bacterium]